MDVVKIDVDGFEPNVLSGMRGTLIAYRPAVEMEYTKETAEAVGGIAGILPPPARVPRPSRDRRQAAAGPLPAAELQRADAGRRTGAVWDLLLTPS